MRKILFLIVLSAACTGLKAQTIDAFKTASASADSLSGAVVRIYEAPSAAEAVAKYSALTQPVSSINGYRIRIYAGNNQSARSEATSAQSQCSSLFDVPVFLTYENPYFMVSCGNCLSQEEAIMLLAKIRTYFPKAFIVQCEIPAESLKK